jgi:predicted dehydrogenase
MKSLVDSGELGDIYYYDSERVNLGLFQPDVSVVWDLAVHDLAIIRFLFPEGPKAVSATGIGHVPGKPANLAYLTLFFDRPMVAHVSVNWLSPVKLRRTLIGGSRRMVVYDDLEPSEKIKIYDKGIELSAGKPVGDSERDRVYETLVGYRIGDMYAPKLDGTEALGREVAHFVDCIRQRVRPESSGEAGLAVVEILEAATRSMEARGIPVELQ